MPGRERDRDRERERDEGFKFRVEGFRVLGGSGFKGLGFQPFRGREACCKKGLGESGNVMLILSVLLFVSTSTVVTSEQSCQTDFLISLNPKSLKPRNPKPHTAWIVRSCERRNPTLSSGTPTSPGHTGAREKARARATRRRTQKAAIWALLKLRATLGFL